MRDPDDDEFNGFFLRFHPSHYAVEMYRKIGVATFFLRDFDLEDFIEMNGWWPWPGVKIPVVVEVDER